MKKTFIPRRVVERCLSSFSSLKLCDLVSFFASGDFEEEEEDRVKEEEEEDRGNVDGFLKFPYSFFSCGMMSGKISAFLLRKRAEIFPIHLMTHIWHC